MKKKIVLGLILVMVLSVTTGCFAKKEGSWNINKEQFIELVKKVPVEKVASTMIRKGVRIPHPDEGFDEWLEKLKKEKYEVSKYNVGKAPELEGFVDDFLNKRNIEFIEPVWFVQERNNPKLLKLLKEYPDIELTSQWVKFKGSPVGKKYSMFNYKLYEADVDNNPENGKEIVLYSGGYYETMLNYDGGRRDIYSCRNIKTKRNLRGVGVASSVSVGDGNYGISHDRNYSGLLKYKGYIYIYSVDQDSFITLSKYNEDKNIFLSSIRFITR